MTREEEARVIERVLSGDVDAYELLVTENQKQVYNLALRITGNPEDAEDVTQEVFIKAYSSLSAFKGESKLSVWLYRLTSNQSIDFLRKNKRRNAVSISVVSDDGDECELDIPDERFAPQDEAERTELRTAINAEINKLPGDYREIIILREIEGMTYDEIGQALGLEEGTVKSRIFRARKKLCSLLINNGNIDGYIPSNKLKEV